MDFKQRLNQLDKEISEECLISVVRKYAPVIEEIKEIAIRHMKEHEISEIQIYDNPTNLIFKKDGKFFNNKDKEISIQELPRIYQDYSQYIAGCNDQRFYSTPSIQYAMQQVISKFRNSVKKSLSDIL